MNLNVVNYNFKVKTFSNQPIKNFYFKKKQI